ncbi:MAG: 2Fe-2S iron-sulfur cluster-binding protein [Oceanococcus sp.]
MKVAEVIRETADACSVVFEIPDELADTFAYKPGQFLTLHVPLGEKPLPRCYSASSSPLIEEALRVTIKRVVDGRASNWICDNLKAGDSLEVAPPAGIFSPKSLDGEFLLFAGGSGITPVLSILRSILHAGQGRIRLVYANRDERSVIFAEELARLSREHPNRLQVIHWLDAVQGVPSQAQLGSLSHGWEAAECFVCGPGIFMDSTAAALNDSGFAHSKVHIERFVSLPDDADSPPAEALGSADAEAANISVQLDGETHQVKGKQGGLLLDTLEEAGLDAPYSCRAGACAACMCQLDSGEVELAQNHVLDQNDLDQGWILGCQAIIRSADVAVSYPE